MTEYSAVTLLDHREPATAESIWRLSRRAYEKEAVLIGAQEFPPLRRRVADIQAADSDFFGILQGSELVAASEVEREGEAHMISSLVVSPDCFRQGLGKRLLQFLLQRFADAELLVETSRENHPAIALYESCGFEETASFTTADGYAIVRLASPAS